MTRFTKVLICAAIAALPTLATAQSETLRVQPGDPPARGLTAGPQPGNATAATAAEWSARADAVCGGDSLIIYDEDENGEPVGPVTISCLDD